MARALGATVPWIARSASPKIPLLDRAFMGVFDRFARTAIRVGRLRIILPNGEELVYGGHREAFAVVRHLSRPVAFLGFLSFCLVG